MEREREREWRRRMKADPLAAHRTVESLTGEGFLRRELALALKSEKCNRGKRMDLVLGLSDGTEDEVATEESELRGASGVDQSTVSSSSNGRTGMSDKLCNSVKKAHNMSKALELAEENARSSNLSHESPKNYVVNVEDLSVSATSKENMVPSFNTSRGVRTAKRAVEVVKAIGGAKVSNKPQQKHNKFMARYGLQKYASLFKAI